MSDLISRQAAIDAIESHIRTAQEPYVLQRADEIMNYALEVSTSCICNLPSAEPKWIPVTERLPEEEDYHDFWEFPDGAVLWCKDTGEIGIGWYYRLSNNWGDLWGNAVRNIVAWMPLPECYRG